MASSAGGKRVCSSSCGCSCEGSEGSGLDGVLVVVFEGEGEAISVASESCSVGFDVVSEEVEGGGCDAVSWSLVEVGESGSKDLKESLSEDG